MTTNSFDLTGKIALVTGASRGIGEAIARLLAMQGAHVIVSSRKVADCQTVADAIIPEGGRAEALACNVGNMADIAHGLATIREAHGRLDILVNNAATNPYFGHILDTDLAAYNKTVDANIRGYFFMSIEAGKLMKAQGGGAIVNTASVNALQPGDRQGIYSITKAAVVKLTRAFAKECRPLGIRVNALLPVLPGPGLPALYLRTQKLARRWSERSPGTSSGARGNGWHGALPRLRRRQLHQRRMHCGRWRSHSLMSFH